MWVTKSALRGSQSTAPATKSAFQGSPSAVPATKSALRGSPSAVPATKSALRGSQSAAPASKSALRGSAPATKSALRVSPSAVTAMKSALRGSQSAAPARKSAHRGSQSAARATKSANEPHVQKSRFTAPVTKSELLDDHHHSKVLHLPRKLHFEVTYLRSTCHEKSTLEHLSTRFPLRLPRKVTAMCENAHSTTTRVRSTRCGHPDSASLRSRNALGGVGEA